MWEDNIKIDFEELGWEGVGFALWSEGEWLSGIQIHVGWD
jgi:hypothetical protein